MSIFIPGIGFVDPAQLGLLIFFIGGLATTLHPCLFPILPLSLLKMFKADTREKTLKVTTVLVSGQLLAFALLSIGITLISTFLRINFFLFNAIMGVLLVITSIILFFPTISAKINALLPKKESQLDGLNIKYLDVFFLGLGYTLLASPCAGTTFVALLLLISAVQDLTFIVMGFPFFFIGLALPYYILAISTNEFRLQISRWMVQNALLINKFLGVLLLFFGIGMILPVFGGSPWWETYSEPLLIIVGLFLGFLIVFSFLSYIRRYKVERKQNVDDLGAKL